MLRDRPYNIKPSGQLFILIGKVLKAKFYLVQQTGPLSVLLKSETGRLYKVSLGNSHYCSCGKSATSHCIHTLYVLMRIFKVGMDSPLLWQMSFLDTQIVQILNNRHQNLDNPFPSNQQSKVKRLDPQSEECAICQEPMSRDDQLAYCKQGCGHNFHNHCMKVWGQHKVSSGLEVSCPMCRKKWGLTALQELQTNQAQSWGPQRILHDKNAACESCYQFPIRCNIHRCLECPKAYFCKRCAFSQHRPHHFLMRKTHRHKWQSPEQGVSLSQYIFRVLIECEGSKCCYCGGNYDDFVILACGHTAHKACVKKKLEEEVYTCGIDQRPILRGIEVVSGKAREQNNLPRSDQQNLPRLDQRRPPLAHVRVRSRNSSRRYNSLSRNGSDLPSLVGTLNGSYSRIHSNIQMGFL